MNDREITRLTGMLSTWMQSNEEMLTAILNTGVSIQGSEVVENPAQAIFGRAGVQNFIAFPVNISGVVGGTIYMVMQTADLAVIIDLMIGGNGTAPMEELDDMHIIVFVQAIKQLASSLSKILSENLDAPVDVGVDKPAPSSAEILMGPGNIAIQYGLGIAPVLKSNFQLLLPSLLCQELVNQVQNGGNQRVGGFNQESSSPGMGQNMQVRKARFPSLGAEDKSEETENIDIMMDIPLELTVVLGKTGINLKDLVELKSGSIFALDKMAGEPVELYINDRFVGYGEVIVIDDNFGVRVIEVPTSADASRGGGGRRR